MSTPENATDQHVSQAIYDIPLARIDGTETSLGAWRGDLLLIVNVASKCGFTPQYATLEQLQEQYRERGLIVLGFPCNQFLGQEPGSDEQIQEFCSATYGVSFPMFSKIKVNGRDRHPLFQHLVEIEDPKGHAGRVQWNFEKFLVAPDGTAHRFRSRTTPDDPAVIAAIEDALNRHMRNQA